MSITFTSDIEKYLSFEEWEELDEGEKASAEWYVEMRLAEIEEMEAADDEDW